MATDQQRRPLSSSSCTLLLALSSCTTLRLWRSSHRTLLATKCSLLSFELQLLNFHFQTFTCFRIFSIFAITVLPQAVQLLPCTSISVCHCVSSIEECELCCGVGGIILLLDAGGLSLVTQQNSSLPENPPKQTSAFGRKKRTAVQQIPHQSPRKEHHTLQSPPKRGKQAHQSQEAPQAHSSKSQNHSQTCRKDHSHKSPQELPQLSKSSP